MANITPSLQNAIAEEPDRFLKDIDFKKIRISDNPQKEFLRQIERKFDSTTGLFLWKFLLDNYSTTNKFYKIESVQENLPEEVLGNLDREEVREFYEEYKEKKTSEQRRREEMTKKVVKVSAYKTTKAHSRGKAHKYTDLQNSLILSLQDLPAPVLADKFNDSFGTKISSVGLRDRRLRLLGRK